MNDFDQIRFRFFKDLNPDERLKVFKAFGLVTDAVTGKHLNHSVEASLLKRIVAAKPATNPYPTRPDCEAEVSMQQPEHKVFALSGTFQPPPKNMMFKVRMTSVENSKVITKPIGEFEAPNPLLNPDGSVRDFTPALPDTALEALDELAEEADGNGNDWDKFVQPRVEMIKAAMDSQAKDEGWGKPPTNDERAAHNAGMQRIEELTEQGVYTPELHELWIAWENSMSQPWGSAAAKAAILDYMVAAASQQAAVPHECHHTEGESNVTTAWINGWNDCRNTMLGELTDDPTNHAAPAIQQPQDAEETARLNFVIEQRVSWYPGYYDGQWQNDKSRGTLCYGHDREKAEGATMREAIDAARAAVAKGGTQ